MIAQSRIKIVGAFVVGLAIVAGAYTVKTFGRSSIPPPNNLSATVSEAPLRVLIDTKDSNNDGVEDWRDELVESSPVIIKQEGETYVAPETLTGQVSVAFFERILASEGYEGISKSKEQIVEETAEQMTRFATDKIIDIRDILVSNDSSSEAIRLYANAHADAIINNSVYDFENELVILRDVLNGQDPNGVENLKILAKVYLDTRDDILKLPVPPQLVKEHLDLINVYNALYYDIEAMSKSIEDPVLSFLRIKRYEEDTLGLGLALQNMYFAIEPYAEVFEKNDSAILFVTFSPDLQ